VFIAANLDAMLPDPGDEAPHDTPAAAGASWREWWSFEFGDAPGLRGAVGLTFRPVAGVAEWWTRLDIDDLGLVVVRDRELSLPRRPGALVVRGDGLWADLVCETPFEHWTIGMEAFGLLVDDVDEEIGERIPVGLDLEWEIAVGAVVETPPGGYALDGTMRGEVLVADRRFELDARSRREHRWGGS
jgi:hypothetical protein